MVRIAWMIERRLTGAKDWIPHKLAGRVFGSTTRALAREEAEHLARFPVSWRYRAVPYLPRVDRTGRRR